MASKTREAGNMAQRQSRSGVRRVNGQKNVKSTRTSRSKGALSGTVARGKLKGPDMGQG